MRRSASYPQEAGRKTSPTPSSAKRLIKRRSTFIPPRQRPTARRSSGSNASAAKTRSIIDWLDNAPLDPVPLGQLADRIVAFVRARRSDAQTVITWRERNRHALREFWARAPDDALGVKQEIEKTLAQNGSLTK